MRAGTALFDEAGKPAGRVTSGGFGPSVQHPVAMGYVADVARQARHAAFSPTCAARKSRSTSTPSPSRRIAIAKDELPWRTTYFTEDHEWIRVEGGIATVGITDYAQEQLGDLVFVELPEAGRKVKKGDSAVVVESVKAASDVYAPADGEITEANTALSSDPALVNSAPTGDGWLWKMKLADESQLSGLLDEAGYKAHDRLNDSGEPT